MDQKEGKEEIYTPYLQSIVSGTNLAKVDRGKTTTATWYVPATANNLPLGLRTICCISN
jgi:hypothetical protein